METVKEGKFFKSNKEGESAVLGKFAVIKVLNAFKSKSNGKRFFNEITVCIIKIDNASNKDIVCHEILPGDAKSERLKARFKTAWADFVKKTKSSELPAAGEEQPDKEALDQEEKKD